MKKINIFNAETFQRCKDTTCEIGSIVTFFEKSFRSDSILSYSDHHNKFYENYIYEENESSHQRIVKIHNELLDHFKTASEKSFKKAIIFSDKNRMKLTLTFKTPLKECGLNFYYDSLENHLTYEILWNEAFQIEMASETERLMIYQDPNKVLESFLDSVKAEKINKFLQREGLKISEENSFEDNDGKFSFSLAKIA